MLAKSKKTLEELNKKYGISGNNTKPTSTKSEKKKQNNSSAPSLDDLNKKYGIGEKSNTKKATTVSTFKTPTTKPSTTLSGETNKTSFATETKNAYTNAKTTANSKTTITSNLSEKDRKARIKEIESEMRNLNYTLQGLGRANAYTGKSGQDFLAKKGEETRKRKAELEAELKSLQRVGTFSASELKQFEIEDAKAEKAKLPNYNPTARIMPHQVESFKQNVQAHSEADKEIDLLKGQKGLYKNISNFGGVVNNDDFGGQWRANYRYADLTRDADKAMNEYLINPTEENRQIAYAYDAFVKEYAKNNEKALDDENVKASWLTKSMAGYLPQFRDQLVPELLGGGIGYLIAGKAGSSIGAGLGSFSQMYDVMRGSVYRTLLAEGVDEQTALEAAEDEALLSALIEGGGTAIGWALSGGGKALEAIGNAATKSVAKGSTNAATKYVANKFLTTTAKKASESALKTAGKVGLGVVGNALSEYGEEFAQQGVSIANKERVLNGSDEGLLAASGKVIKDAVTGKNAQNFAEMHEAGKEGFKIGLMFGGTSTVVNNSVSRFLNAKTIQEQNEALDFVRNDEETLDTLIEEAKASGEGTVSEKIATEIEKAREKGKEVTRDQVKRLIASNDVYIKNEEAVADYTEQTNEPDLMEAAREAVINKSKRRGKVTAENLDELTADNQPITVDEVKQVTGFGDRGARVITGIANKNGMTFSQAVNSVESAYLAGATGMTLAQVEGQLRNDVQRKAFEAGMEDRVLQDAEKQAQVQNVTTYEGVFHENEHTNNYTEHDKKMIATVAKALKMDVSAVDKILANITFDAYGDEVYHYANASHNDGKMEIASHRARNKAIYSLVMHESGHRMRQLAPKEFGSLMDVLYQRAVRLNRAYTFEYITDQHNEAGLKKNTRDNIEEIAVRELETIFSSAKEFNKWYAEISQNQAQKNNVQKFFEWIRKVIDEIKTALSQLNMTAEERAAAKEELEELNRIKDLLANTLKSAEKTATELANLQEKSSNNLEIKTKKEYNGNTNYSLNSRTRYNEYNTIGMQWAYSSSTEIGDLKVLFKARTGKYVLVEATKEDVGFIELKVGTYKQLQKDVELYESNKEGNFTDNERNIDKAIHNFETGQNNNNRDNVNAGNRGTGIQDAEVLEGKSESNGTTNSQAINRNLEKTSFSLQDTIEETKDLIAVHNTSESQLEEVLDRGHFIMPSTAVTNKSFTAFGDISVVLYKEAIDPENNQSNKLYGADAWTPTQTTLKINPKFDNTKTNAVVQRIKNSIGNGWSQIFDVNGVMFKNTIKTAQGSVYGAYAENIGVQTAYAIENGIIENVPRTNGKINVAKLKETLDEKLNKDEVWRNYKKWLGDISNDIITSYDKATTQDIINNMKAQPDTAKVFNLSENGELTVPSVEYKSIDEMRNNKNRLSENAEADAKAVGKEFVSWANGIAENSGVQVKNVIKAINSSFNNRYNVMGIKNSFKTNGVTLTQEDAKALQSLYKKAVELTTLYFEAKPQRTVGFEEVAHVVLPKNTSEALKSRLAENGVAFTEYEKGNKAERVEALNSVQGVQFSLVDSEGNTSTDLDNVGIQYDSKSKSIAPSFSLMTWRESQYVEDRETAIKAIMKAINVSKKDAERYIDNVNSISKMIADDRERLDYEPNMDKYASVLKSNSEYKWTVDMSTLCAKRLLTTGTFDAIQKALPNAVFDSDDIVNLRTMLLERGYEVACGICYVESTRRELGTITADFIERYKESQKSGRPITRINSEGKMVELTKTQEQMETTKDKSSNKFYADKNYTPTLAELNTTDIDIVKRDHPLVYEAYLNFMNARGQAKPKLLETRAEYKGEILKHFKVKTAVNARNKAGGLRVQSFSDFEVAHLIDMMQIVLDMSQVGLMSQAYTKVPAFADVFGGTGMKINLSLIAKGNGLDKNGNLIFDDVEGMPHEEAFRLREKYSKNVGTILVGKNDAHIRAALADPRIDFVIPFHKSSWKESLYDALGLTGYEDYTDTQNEKPFDKDRKIKNFQPSEYWDYSKSGEENAKTYLKMCAEDGRIPKFPQFQICEGYWKLLIDFKMYDNDGIGSPQPVVMPEFDMDAATSILNEYKGGHRSLPVAQDVVDDFVNQYKNKGSSFSLMDTESRTTSKDTKALLETIEHLKNEFKVTKFAKADPKKLAKLTKDLLKEYSSKGNYDETYKAIDELYQYIANGEDGHPAVWDDLYSRASEIAKSIVESAVVVDDEMYNMYKGLRDYLRKTPMKFDTRYDSVPSSYENFQEFKRRNWGRFNFTNDGVGVDGVYQELAGLYPEFFNAEEQTNVADQLERIVDALDELKPREINPHSQGMRQTISYLANDIIDRFFDIPQAKPTFADKAERRVMAERIKGNKKVEAVRQQKDEKIQKLIERQRENTKKQIEKLREQRDARVKKEQQKRREAISKLNETQKAKVLRAQIARHAGDLSKKLVSPTDNQHIPEDLKGVVAKLLECINLESNYSYHPESHSYKKDEKGLPTRRTQAFNELKKLYGEIASSVVVDPDLLGDNGLLSDVISLADKRIADMSSTELQTVWDAVRAIEASVNTTNRVFSQGKFETILEFAESLREDNADKKEKTEFKGVIGKGKKLVSLDMLTPETYFHYLGSAGDSIFRMMRDAQDKHISIMKEVADFTRKTLKDVNVNSLEKTMHTVKLGGKDVKLSTAQLMELYALMKREQAIDHILVGGILPDITEGKGLKLNTKAEPIRNLSVAEITEALSNLTDEQKKIADALQKFVSTTLSEYGNEASMKVYNYEKFLEKNYWTIRTNKQEIMSDVGKDTAVTTVANKGMAKGTKPHANTSVRIGSIFDTFAAHSSDMATYSAWLGTSEDVNRIRNFVFWEDGARTGTVKGILDTVHGIHGSDYLQKLLTDVSIGVKGTDNMNPLDKLIGNYKAASVGANVRVVIQQPTAILRAMDMLDARYLAVVGNPLKGWEKAKKYAPIAQWKDWGHFDINTGRQMKDVLFDNASLLEKTKQVGMWGASMADSISWGQLWNAVETETKAKHKALEVGSEEYYETVAKRFTEIVDHTQVVDGILQRSQIMRSPDALTKMATSFMGEPTKQYNMAVAAAYDAMNSKGETRKKAVAKLGRTATALAVAGIINACAQSIIDAMRDDDKEKDYWEKWLAAFIGDEDDKMVQKFGNLGDTFNPLSYVPFVKDVFSVFAGYDVKRMDMEAITKTSSAVANMYKAVTGTGKYTIAEASAQLFAEASRLWGLPVANVKRDIKSAVMTVAIESENYLMQYRMEKTMLDINYAGNSKNFMDILFNAYNNDRKAYELIYKDMIKNGVKADTIQNGMESRMMKAQGVEKKSQLTKRYMSPTTEKTYNRSLKQIKTSDVWKSANATQRKDAQADLYNYLTSTTDTMKETRAEAKAHGIDETEYILWNLAIEMADQPKGEKGSGSYDLKEKAEAVNSLNLGDEEIAYFFGKGLNANSKEEINEVLEAGIDMEDYVNFKAAASEMTADKNAKGNSIPNSKKRKVVNYLNNADLTEEEWNYFYYEIMNYKK